MEPNLINRAIGSFHTKADLPFDDRRTEDPIPTQPSLSLISLSSDFNLTQEEEILLKDIIHQRKLALNLTLFDLLIFDLHEEMAALQHCVKKEDCDRLTGELQTCYATLLEDKMKETAQLSEFLQKVIWQYTESNYKVNDIRSGSDQQHKAKGNTQHIKATLHARVELLKKIEKEAHIFHHQFFVEPLSQRIDNPLYTNGVDLKEAFESNSCFIQWIYNSSLKTKPELRNHAPLILSFIQSVQAIGNRKSDQFLKKMKPEKWREALGIIDKIAPHLFKICTESILSYNKLIGNSLVYFQSIDPQKFELEVQKGFRPSIFFEEASSKLDPNDLLALFKKENQIDFDFQLTMKESLLLQELFQYPLDSNMTMLDLLGFALFDRLENIKGIIPSFDKQISETQAWISAMCWVLLFGFIRSKAEQIKSLGPVNEISENFFIFPDGFTKKIDRLFEVLLEGLSAIQPISKKTENLTKKNKEKIREKLANTVTPVKDLFFKLALSKGNFNLLLKSLSSYQKHESLDQKNRLGRATVKKYWNYVKIGNQKGFSNHWFRQFPFKIIMNGELSFADRPSEKQMREFGRQIIEGIICLDHDNRMCSKEYSQALKGELDHSEWKEKHQIKTSDSKTQGEFKEQLYADLLHLDRLIHFLLDILLLVEKRMYPEGTLSTISCVTRLRHNIDRFQNRDTHIPLPCLPNAIPAKFTTILDPIKDAFIKNHADLFDYALFHTDSGIFKYEKWLDLLILEEEAISSLLDNSLCSLSKLKGDLLEDIKKEWSSLSKDQLKKIDVALMKEAIFKEGLQLFRPLLILSDMLALLQRRHYSEEAAIIPKELAYVMELDGLEEILQSLAEEKLAKPILSSENIEAKAIPPTQEENVVQSPTHDSLPTPSKIKRENKNSEAKAVPPSQEEDVVQSSTHESLPALSKPKKKRETKAAKSLNRQRNKKTLPPPASLPATQEKEILDLANLTKSRLILAKLKQMNFFEKRQTGSHHILKNTEGGTVVVPNNDNMPRGTLESITDQVRQARAKKSSPEL